MEKLDPSPSLVGMKTIAAPAENSWALPQQVRQVTTWPQTASLAGYPRGLRICWCQNLHMNIHSSITHDRQRVGLTRIHW